MFLEQFRPDMPPNTTFDLITIDNSTGQGPAEFPVLMLEADCKAAASTLLHSSAPSNLSHCGLVQPLLSASHRHCSVLSHCTTAVHAVLIVLLLPIPFSLGLAHQCLSPHCSLQSCIVSSPLPLTEHHWPQSYCLLTDPHLAFRFPYH
jgi:hypothetical protein